MPDASPQHGAVDDLSLRPIAEADLPFLQSLYGTTREAELDRTGWSPEQKAAFVEMQFRAQHQHYQQHFGGARFDLILKGGQSVGRLYVDRRPDEIRIIDIALMPEHRGNGTGGHLMRQLLGEAGEKRLPVRIHVEQFNPALRLYDRLGFRKVHDEGVYFLLEWQPPD